MASHIHVLLYILKSGFFVQRRKDKLPDRGAQSENLIVKLLESCFRAPGFTVCLIAWVAKNARCAAEIRSSLPIIGKCRWVLCVAELLNRGLIDDGPQLDYQPGQGTFCQSQQHGWDRWELHAES